MAAGRRSGKTEVGGKRRPILEALVDARFSDGRTVFAAPTQDQARDIFWPDLKAMVPPAVVREVRESYPQTIVLTTGHRMEIRGLDRPQRIVGSPLDRIVITEVDDLKDLTVIDEEVLPALGTTGRLGCGIFEGVPNGMAILWALRERALDPENPDWEYFEWPSSEVLLPEEDEFWRRNLDPETYDREFNASFRNFSGRAYYPFDWKVHAVERLEYDPRVPLRFCFDFNVDPGVAVIVQEQAYRGRRTEVAPVFTAVVGEVHIPEDSNTEKVCRKLVEDWGGHRGPVYCYGDASGGARHTSQTEGSDWDLIAGRGGILRRHFGARLRLQVPEANPLVKPRVNALNTRLSVSDLTSPGRVRMLVDPARAHRTCLDLDGVTLVKGGAFEIDKKKCEKAGLTHLSDALGYYVHEEHPLRAAAAAGTIRMKR